MIKKRIIYLLTVFLVVTAIFSSSLLATDNFLWELSGPEGEFYLMGSFHYMPENSYPLNDVIYNKLEKADVMAVEVNVSEIDQLEMQQFVMEEALLEENRELQNKISEESYEEIIDITARHGFQEEDINSFAPWYTSLILADLALHEVGMETAEGVDIHMIEQAQEKDIEIVELESMMEQLKLLSGMELDIQKALVEDTIEELEYDISRIQEAVTGWQEGEVEPISEFIFERRYDSPEMEEYYTKFFDEREIKMRDNILSLLDEYETPFVVVGSGHVVNEVGLLYLFEELGYDIEQL